MADSRQSTAQFAQWLQDTIGSTPSVGNWLVELAKVPDMNLSDFTPDDFQLAMKDWQIFIGMRATVIKEWKTLFKHGGKVRSQRVTRKLWIDDASDDVFSGVVPDLASLDLNDDRVGCLLIASDGCREFSG
eukprot:TRINITY_DN7749_c0_g1_i1.p1 TRINITY_DN7749_c0_g1~~TRINITY_DN7749_c0_g1_i1.p1  ORF type:complete len:131 (-),score=20.54 TRINITY_DN7749_c0_g1_i1:14-406(-)